LEIGRNYRVPNHSIRVGGVWQPFCVSPETTRWRLKCETGLRHV
jgi:hypothetical protein